MSARGGHRHDQTVPAAALWGAFALIVVSIGLAAVARGDLEHDRTRRPTPSTVSPRAERMLRFEDRADGAVVVIDDHTGAVHRVLGPEGHGFVRGVMRGLFRARKLDGINRNAPFRLTMDESGHLTLTDLHTQRSIDLHAFGSSNVAAFALLLEEPEGQHAH